MTAMEYAITDAQMSQIQKWVVGHDKTVKFVALVITMMFILQLLVAFGVISNG